MEFTYNDKTQEWVRKEVDTKEYTIVFMGHRFPIPDFMKTNYGFGNEYEYLRNLIPCTEKYDCDILVGRWKYNEKHSQTVALYNDIMRRLNHNVVVLQQSKIEALEKRMKKMEEVFDYIRSSNKEMDAFISIVREKEKT